MLAIKNKTLSSEVGYKGIIKDYFIRERIAWQSSKISAKESCLYGIISMHLLFGGLLKWFLNNSILT